MAIDNEDLIKRRDIQFMSPQQDSDPANAAIALLNDIEGIFETIRVHEFAINVSYNVCHITLCDIEDVLQELRAIGYVQ